MILDLVPLAIFDASQFFSWFVENANYWFVFIFMIIESSFIPFPSELVVPPAAYLAMQEGSSMNIYVVTLVATAGAIVGAIINYYLALWVGRPIVYAFANSRAGHALLIDSAKVEKAEAYFDKHGAISTFIGRLIPAVRQLISIPAGLARMIIELVGPIRPTKFRFVVEIAHSPSLSTPMCPPRQGPQVGVDTTAPA